jgi:hypothetical protein
MLRETTTYCEFCLQIIEIGEARCLVINERGWKRVACARCRCNQPEFSVIDDERSCDCIGDSHE